MSSDRVAEAVLSGDFVRTMRAKALEDSGNTIRLMTIGHTGGWRNFANTERRVTGPDAMAGLKLRTVVADLPVQLLDAMGASATPIPWPGLCTSLPPGVVAGPACGISDITGMKFPDAGLQYRKLDGDSDMGAMWWMNNDNLLAMPDDLRRVVVDGFSALQQATFASPKRKSIEAYEAFVAGCGDIYVPSPEEKAAFAAAAAPVNDWFRATVDGGSDMLAALVAAVAEVEAEMAEAYAADLN